MLGRKSLAALTKRLTAPDVIPEGKLDKDVAKHVSGRSNFEIYIFSPSIGQLDRDGAMHV